MVRKYLVSVKVGMILNNVSKRSEEGAAFTKQCSKWAPWEWTPCEKCILCYGLLGDTKIMS